jgi:hypothetical protein
MYFYGPSGEELYYETDLESAANEYWLEGEIELVELKVSRYENPWCMIQQTFDHECVCDDYKARNGKWGICKHRSYGMVETGAKWTWDGEKLTKISGRNK